MTNKSIRDYINLIENLQREGVAEESDKQFAQRMKKQAEQPPTKGMSQKEKEDKGWAKPKEKGVAEGSEQVYKVIAVDKSNYLGGKEEMTVKADSIEDLFSRLSANDWYPLEINGVEVIAGKRLKKSADEEQLEETSPEAIAKIGQLTRRP
jgi:hypothetical protein